MEVRINIVELASNLAHNELVSLLVDDNLIYEEPFAGMTNYTDDAQELFDTLYDKYYDSILECTM